MTEAGQWSGRREDARLMAGSGCYVSDIHAADCVELAFVRSYSPHARVIEIDVAPALGSPGVVAAYSAAELPHLPPVPVSHGNEGPSKGRDRPSLPSDTVRFTGEAVAVVAASDRYSAEDAADRVWVDLDPLQPVTDPREAVKDSSPKLYPPLSNLALDVHMGSDVSEQIATAPVVVRRADWNRRLSHSPMEGRAILVVPEGDHMTIWVSHQAPHRLKAALVAGFGDRVPRGFRVRTPDVGGAFGQKSHTYPEYMVAVEVALALGRPVRWIEDRRESLIAAAHGRDQYQRISLASDLEGNLLAAEFEIIGDLGAYTQTGSYVPLFTGAVISGPYAIPAISAKLKGVVTNKAPTCPYRGAGRPEAAYLIERAMDDLAARLSMDPAELRFRNFVPASGFPYRTATGITYDSGNYSETLRVALSLVDYEAAKAERAARRSGDGLPLGIGICTFVEFSGGADPSPEYGAIEVGWDGGIVVRSGSAATGQGHETVFSQLVASVLGVDPSRVTVLQKDTDEVPKGVGSFASRSMQVGGSALYEAASDLLQTAYVRAADLLGVSEGLVYDAGVFADPGTGKQITIDQVAEKAGPLSSEVMYSSPRAFPSGSYVAVVEVDPETGQAEIVRLAAVDDSGTILNPWLVHGQTEGSVAQGVGQALYEEFVYDDEGQPLTSTFMDYLLPTASELPELRLAAVESPNPNSPIGAKGAGEAGTSGTPPAVINAIVDALRPLGVTDMEMPASPNQVWSAISRATAGGNA